MTTKPREEWNHNCTSHCAGCGAHFTGQAPFDAHRVKGECKDPSVPVFGEKSKYAGQPILEAIEGRCDKMAGCWEDGKRVRWVEPVALWRMAVVEAPSLQAALF